LVIVMEMICGHMTADMLVIFMKTKYSVLTVIISEKLKTIVLSLTRINNHVLDKVSLLIPTAMDIPNRRMIQLMVCLVALKISLNFNSIQLEYYSTC
jgi:hypothetical protein